MGKEGKGTEKWDRKYKETKVKNGGTVATNGEGSGDCEIRVVIEEAACAFKQYCFCLLQELLV